MISRCCGVEYKEIHSEMFNENKLLCSECNEYCEEKECLDPTPQEWAELKKNLPKFFQEAIQFAVIMGIILMFSAFVILQVIKLLHLIW